MSIFIKCVVVMEVSNFRLVFCVNKTVYRFLVYLLFLRLVSIHIFYFKGAAFVFSARAFAHSCKMPCICTF